VRVLSLLSGGLDSVVATAAARAEGRIVAALTADYGQRARVREIAAAAKVAAWIGCEHLVVALPWLGQLGRNALTDEALPVPELHRDELDDLQLTEQTAAAVWVPNRNGVLLNVAAAYAEALECDAIVCGFNAEEGATFPDNTPEFMSRADAFFELSTRRHPRVISPTVGLTKRQIVALGWKLGAPLEAVWSCYHGGEEQCGVCESCRRLQRALAQA
jgi:7-cyano-7-deazaguanine synthase